MPRSALPLSPCAPAPHGGPGPRAPRFSVVADMSTRRLHVAGEFDLAVVDRFGAVADSLTTSQPGDVVLDLGATTFIDASGLGAVVRLANTVARDGHTLRVADVPASARRVFGVAGLSELLPGLD